MNNPDDAIIYLKGCITNKNLTRLKLYIINYNVEDNFNLIFLIEKSYDELNFENCVISYPMRQLITDFLILQRTLVQIPTINVQIPTTNTNVFPDKVIEIGNMISELRTQYTTTIKNILLNIQSMRSRFFQNLKYWNAKKITNIYMPFNEVEFILMFILNYLQNQVLEEEIKINLNFSKVFNYLDKFQVELLNVRDRKRHESVFTEILEDYDKLNAIYCYDRIKWTIEIINSIDEHDDPTNRSLFLLKLKFIWKNIFVLEKSQNTKHKYLKKTQQICFEQIKFYIELYIKFVDTNYHYLPILSCILNNGNLRKYLDYFKEDLEIEDRKKQLPKNSRYIRNQLFADYILLKNYVLLENMLYYLKSVTSILTNDSEDFWKLNIERTIQVLGECIVQLKNLKKTIKFSASVTRFTNIIEAVRHKLSHYPWMLKRYDANFNELNFTEIQQELNFITEYIKGLLLVTMNEMLKKYKADDTFLKDQKLKNFIISSMQIFRESLIKVEARIRDLRKTFLEMNYSLDHLHRISEDNTAFPILVKYKSNRMYLKIKLNENAGGINLNSVCSIFKEMILTFNKQNKFLIDFDDLLVSLKDNTNIKTQIDTLFKLYTQNTLKIYSDIFENNIVKDRVARIFLDQIIVNINEPVLQLTDDHKNDIVNLLARLNELDLKEKYEILSRYFPNSHKKNTVLTSSFISEKEKFQTKLMKRKILFSSMFTQGNDGTRKIKPKRMIKNAFEILILECKEILQYLSLLPEDRYFLDGYSPMLIGRNGRNYIAHDSVLFRLMFKEKIIAFHCICKHFYDISDIFELQPYSTTNCNLNLLQERYEYAVSII